jgi:biopolymer transport protein ExbD
VIEADGAVRYDAVVKVMSELQKAGIERVGLSVQVK